MLVYLFTRLLNCLSSGFFLWFIENFYSFIRVGVNVFLFTLNFGVSLWWKVNSLTVFRFSKTVSIPLLSVIGCKIFNHIVNTPSLNFYRYFLCFTNVSNWVEKRNISRRKISEWGLYRNGCTRCGKHVSITSFVTNYPFLTFVGFTRSHHLVKSFKPMSICHLGRFPYFVLFLFDIYIGVFLEVCIIYSIYNYNNSYTSV